MKLIKFLIVLVCVAVGSLTASAESNNRVGVSYNGTNFKNGWSDDLGHRGFFTNGMGVEYTHGFALPGHSVIEVGGSFTAAVSNQKHFKANDDGKLYTRLKTKNIYLAVPVNYVYTYRLNNLVTLLPYVGINLKYNFSMRMNATHGYDMPDGSVFEHSWYGWQNLYKDSNILYNPEKWNRFQAGWQVGVGAQISFMYVGVQYGTDFVPAMHSDAYNVTDGTVKAIVAYCF